MTAASEYLSKETLEQVSTESFAQNVANYRALLIRWGKEVDADSVDDKRAQLLFKEASMLQEIIQGQMSEARSRGTSIGVPRQELDEVVDIYANVLRKLIRSEEHTSELQSQSNLVCRLLLEKKKKK